MRTTKYQPQKGQKFGMLTYSGELIKIVEKGKYRRTHGVFVCDCGNQATFRPDNVMRGMTISCGCQSRSNNYRERLWKTYSEDYPYYVLHKIMLKRVKKSGIDCTITVEDVKTQFEKQNGICIYTGQQLILPTKFQDLPQNNIASIDRIDSKLGYIPGNIQFVTKQINFAKQTLSHQDFIALCQSVVHHCCA